MNLSSIGKILIQYPIPFVCGLLCFFLGVLIVMRGPKVEEYEQQLAEMERRWQAMQMNLDRSKGIEEDIEQIERAHEEVKARLLEPDEVAVNSEFFYDLEEATGISLTQFSQGSASNGSRLPLAIDKLDHFRVVPFDLSVTGTLPEMLELLSRLDRSRYIIRMEKLDLNLPSGGATESMELLSGRLQCHILADPDE